MLIYSETSKVFIERVREEIRSLFFLEIENKLPLKFERSRTLYRRTYFPLTIVVFEDNERLGYFDYRYYEIGISKKLMYTAFDEVLRNIIRHELAHYIAYLMHGADLGHGEKFNELCRSIGWGEDVYRAYSHLDSENLKVLNPKHKNEELLNKIKKLLALSASDNIHESEMATMKANQLLLDYNLSLINLESTDEKEVFVKRVLDAPKKNAKLLAIYEILKTFYVSPVFNHGKNNVYLEIVGSASNVEMAEYVAHFLDHELDRQWNHTKSKNHHLKGMAAKNSFFRGLAQGYLEKINHLTKNYNQNNSKALSNIQDNLKKDLQMAYSRLRSSSGSEYKNHSDAHHLGKAQGRDLSIRPGIKNNQSQTLLLS